MKIYIFGANGMLGKYLTTHLNSFYEVIPITRKEVDLTDDFNIIIEKYKFHDDDVIINAAGIIKQRLYNTTELIKVNSLFPHFLSTLNCNVIHITTDCVFSGKHGSYNEDSLHDCLDDYGKSKSLGEPNNVTVIRTSIIGEELLNKKSLLEWAKSKKGTSVNGFINHFWNGVTCLELSKQIKIIIDSHNYWKGVRHYHSPGVVSKCHLLKIMSDVYNLELEIIPQLSYYCDRSLKTKYNNCIDKSIKQQLIELKNLEKNYL